MSSRTKSKCVARKTLSVLLIILTLTSCGGEPGKEKDEYLSYSKKELVTMARTYETTIKDQQADIEAKTTLLKGVQTSKEPTTAISTIEDGTGRLTFNEFSGGYITLPTDLQYLGSTVTTSSNKVYINDYINFEPTPNWVINMQGSNVELENKDLGIGLKLSIGKIVDQFSVANIKEYICVPFFAAWPPSEIQYHTIFVDGLELGLDATTNTLIDEKPAQIRIGLVSCGDYELTYTACYKSELSMVKEEAIQAILSSIKMNNLDIRIEQ